MLYIVATGRRGGQYEYYVCSGRHTKSNNCTAPFIDVARIDDAVATLWDREHRPWQTDSVPRSGSA